MPNALPIPDDLIQLQRARLAAEGPWAAGIRPEEEPPETDYVQPCLVEAQLAEALISLGNRSPARAYAEQAVRVQAHPRGQVHRMATLTTVDLGRGEVEQAAANAVAALQLAGGMESQRLRERLSGVPQAV